MGSFGLYFHITVHLQGTSGQEPKDLEAGTEAEPTEESCLLACVHSLLSQLFVFFYFWFCFLRGFLYEALAIL